MLKKHKIAQFDSYNFIIFWGMPPELDSPNNRYIAHNAIGGEMGVNHNPQDYIPYVNTPNPTLWLS